MQNEWNPPPLAGQPMDISQLLDEMALLALPDGSRVVTIEEQENYHLLKNTDIPTIITRPSS